MMLATSGFVVFIIVGTVYGVTLIQSVAAALPSWKSMVPRWNTNCPDSINFPARPTRPVQRHDLYGDRCVVLVPVPFLTGPKTWKQGALSRRDHGSGAIRDLEVRVHVVRRLRAEHNRALRALSGLAFFLL